MPSPYKYFPMYAADWLTDTAAMSAAARGCYINLLCFQWINGSVPKDIEQLARIAGCIGKFEELWDEFRHKFQDQGDRLRNKRLEIERQKAIRISDQSRRAAEKRWGKSDDDGHLHAGALQDPDAELMRSQCQSESESEEDISYPSGNSSPSELFQLDGNPDGNKNDARKNCPHEKIRALYNDVCVNLPRCKKMTPGRQTALRNRWREHPNLDWWKRYFTYVHEKCPFLNGENQEDRTREGRKPFTADFDWLLKPANMTKVIEQRYER